MADTAKTTNAAMRPFGALADLDLDFGHVDRPALVTTLLTTHGAEGASDPAFWWSRPVGTRIAALLRLLARTETLDALALSAYCVQPACGERFEFALPLHALPAINEGFDDADPITLRLDGQRALRVRRPTGDDLLRWRDARPASREEALRLMLDALVLEGEVAPHDAHAVSASIAAADPLVDFRALAHCPACGAVNDVPVDLEALALARLRTHQQALLREVHQFASHYGWTEAQVLAIPPARRARYRKLIEAAP